jgi:hypothetical protein
MHTFLQLKGYFCRFIGENDASSIDAVGQALLNDALKDISSRFAFECNKKTASLTISSGVDDLPSDFDYSHIDKIRVYRYSSTTKYEYFPVPLDEFSAYSTSEYVYAIDFENQKIKVPDDVSLSMDYYIIPADMDEDTDTTAFPIPQAIARQAAGQYWQSIEEEEDQAKLNLSIADSLTKQAVVLNSKLKAYRPYSAYGGRELGFTKSNTRRKSGYKRYI